jgi:hypothetical protein
MNCSPSYRQLARLLSLGRLTWNSSLSCSARSTRTCPVCCSGRIMPWYSKAVYCYLSRNRALEKSGLVSCIIRVNRKLLFSAAATRQLHTYMKTQFGLQSVLANTSEQLNILRGLSSTNLSNRLPSYIRTWGLLILVADTYAAPSLDRSIVHILQLLVLLLIVPLVQ